MNHFFIFHIYIIFIFIYTSFSFQLDLLELIQETFLHVSSLPNYGYDDTGSWYPSPWKTRACVPV